MAYPKLISIAIINQIDKVLLIRRAKAPEKGKWALVSGTGGFKDESDPQVVAAAEARYNLGVEFSVDYFMNYYYSDVAGEPALSLVFSGKIKDEPKPNPESVAEWRYFSEDEVTGLDLAFEHKKILNDYFYH